MSEFEAVLDDIGAFGPVQIRIFLLVSMFETPAAWGMLLPNFAFRASPWRCSSYSPAVNGNETHLDNDTSLPYPFNTSALRLGNESLVTNGTDEGEACRTFLSGSCQQVDYLADYTSIVTEWNLICGYSYIPTWIKTAQMIGVFLGAFITGQLADTFGRRKVFYIVYALFLLTGFGSSFANSWQLYLMARFLVGATFGGTMVVNFVLPMEFVGRQWRTFCGCIGFWACGVMSLPLMAYLVPNWRHLSMLVSGGGVPLLFTWWFVPESPRWLLIKGRFHEAEDILNGIARSNKRPSPDFEKLRSFSQKEEQKREETLQYSYWDLCRNMQMTTTTCIVLYSWFVCTVVYYGTTWNTSDLTGNIYLNQFVAGLVEIPPLIFVVLVNNRLGRRKTLSILMCIAGVFCFSLLFIAWSGKLQEYSYVTTTMAMIGRSGIAGAWAASQIFSAEVFPTVVRNIGVGASSMAGRIGGVISPQLAHLAAVNLALPYVVYGVLSLIGAGLCFLLPETLNRPLPDTLPPRVFCHCLDKRQSSSHGNDAGDTDHLDIAAHSTDALSNESGIQDNNKGTAQAMSSTGDNAIPLLSQQADDGVDVSEKVTAVGPV